MPGLKKVFKKASKVGSKLANAVPGVGVTKARKQINKVRKGMKTK